MAADLEEEALRDLRQLLAAQGLTEKIIDDDKWLLRFLNAREMSATKTLPMVVNSLKWRKRSGVETILETWKVPELLQRYLPGGFCGEDLEGHPLWLDPFGRGDYEGLSKIATTEEILRTRHHFVENIERVLLPEYSRKSGKCITKTVCILDLKGLSKKHLMRPALTTFQDNITLGMENYPEYLHRCYIVNQPVLFTMLFNFLKPLLEEETQKKIVMLGANFKEELLKDFAADQLPVAYGGTKVDENGDPECSAFINYGGPIPKELYAKFPENLSQVTVGGRRTFTVETLVAEQDVGCELVWLFWTEKRDIIFEVVFQGQAPPPEAPPVSSLCCTKESLLCENERSGSTCSDEDSCAHILFKREKLNEMGELEETTCTELDTTEEMNLLDNTDGTYESENGQGQLNVKCEPMFLLLPRRRVSCYTIPERGKLRCTRPGKYIICFDNTYSWTRSRKLHYRITLEQPT